MMKKNYGWVVACLSVGFSSVLQATPRPLPPIIDHSSYSDPQTDRAVSQPINRRSMMEILQELGRLQSEVQQLRGQVEEQKYELKQLKKRQQRVYMDINQRLTSNAPLSVGSSSIKSKAPKTMKTAVNIQPSATLNKFQGGSSNILEKMDFDKAFAPVRSKEYGQAVIKLKQFLVDHPASQYSDNALFWLASVYKELKDIPAAKDTYNQVIKRYADSDKAALSFLKLGDLYLQDKQFKQAKAVYIEIIQTYANTTEAHQAQKKLQEIDF